MLLGDDVSLIPADCEDSSSMRPTALPSSTVSHTHLLQGIHSIKAVFASQPLVVDESATAEHRTQSEQDGYANGIHGSGLTYHAVMRRTAGDEENPPHPERSRPAHKVGCGPWNRVSAGRVPQQRRQFHQDRPHPN